ncbi:oligosaccharide flippase family protein, partial [bacterium]|nr:oligosaccharide flippase family protein [bacterium]
MRKIIINIFSNSIIRFIPLFTSFFLIPFIIGYIGKEAYGAWAILGAFLGIASVFKFGLGFVLEKEVARYRAKNDLKKLTNFLFSTIPLQIIIVALIGILFYFAFQGILKITNLSPDIQSKLVNLQYVLLIYVIVKFFLDNFISIIMGMEKHYILLIFNFIYVFSYVLSLILMLPRYPDIDGLILSNLFAIIIFFALLFFCILFQLKINISNLTFIKIDKSIFSFSFHSFILQLCALILFNAGKILLGTVVSASEVAYYEIASKIFSVLQNTFDAIARVFLPKASALHEKKNFTIIKQLITQGTLLMLALWGALVVPLCIVLKDFIILWLGPEFLKSLIPAYILCITSGFIVLSRLIMNIFFGIGIIQKYCRIRIIFTIFYIIAAVILTNLYGMIGLACALLLYAMSSEIIIFLYAFR